MATMSVTGRIQETLGLSRSDAGRLANDVARLTTEVEAQGSLLRDLHARIVALTSNELRQEFDSLATAQAESMVYLNRSIRDIRAELIDLRRSLRPGSEDDASADT
jgi:hypothetical protein